MTEQEQPSFHPHLEWAVEGAILLAQVCPVLVVVDVLRSAAAVEVAVSQGAQVVPVPWPGPGSGDPGPYSLSPVSMLGVPAGTRLELASPNGATVAVAAAEAGAVVLAGCLRNASAVAVPRLLGGAFAQLS